jgi:RNA polymerase sigma factor (sigma-70 family)
MAVAAAKPDARALSSDADGRNVRSAAVIVTDGELLRRFAINRDEQAFRILVERHGPLVHTVCRRLLGDANDAEDAFQATFLVLACKAQSIRKIDSVASWLFGVASRLAVNMRSRAARRHRREKQIDNPQGAGTVTDTVSWRETCKVLHEEINRLPEKHRDPLLLCYWQGLTQEEAARQLGLPRGTLKRRLEDGRERLRGRLERRGLILSVLLLAMALGQNRSWGAGHAGLVAATVRAAQRSASASAAAGMIVRPRTALMASRILRALVVGAKVKAAMASLLAGTCAAIALCHPMASGSQQVGIQQAPPLQAGQTVGRGQAESAAKRAPRPEEGALPGDMPARVATPAPKITPSIM